MKNWTLCTVCDQEVGVQYRHLTNMPWRVARHRTVKIRQPNHGIEAGSIPICQGSGYAVAETNVFPEQEAK